MFFRCLMIIEVAAILMVKAFPTEDSSSNQYRKLEENYEATVGRIHDWMDKSIDPCEDFYRFACGNFMKKAILQNNEHKVTPLKLISKNIQKLLQQEFEKNVSREDIGPFRLLKKFYALCTRQRVEDVIESLQEFADLKKIWPSLDSEEWDEESISSWTEVQNSLKELGLPANTIVNVYVDMDVRNSSRDVIWIKPGEFPVQKQMLVGGWKSRYVQRYLNLLTNLVVMYGVAQEEVFDDILEMTKFMIDIGLIGPSGSDYYNQTVMTLESLIKNYSFIPWLHYLQPLLTSKNTNLTKEEVILVAPNYFNDLEMVLNKYSKKAHANYIISTAILNIHLTFTDVVQYGMDSIQSLNCVELTSDIFSHAAGAMYVRKHFEQRSLNIVSEMVKNIKDSFTDLLIEANWLEKTTKRSALEKIYNMIDLIGYPNEYYNDAVLKTFYSELEIPNESHFFNFYQSVKRFLEKKMSRQTDERIKWPYRFKVTTANAFNSLSRNKITIPAGILQGALFGINRPHYLNYGALGFIIGHEISHAFDNNGRRREKNGKMANWWDKKSNSEFLDRIQCLIRQYDNYMLNGTLSINENIADNEGIKVAYMAYVQWSQETGIVESGIPGLNYTPKEMFWIAAAQVWCAKLDEEGFMWNANSSTHSPPEFRVLGPLSNSESFSTDFKCPMHSRMNPKEKCQVWSRF